MNTILPLIAILMYGSENEINHPNVFLRLGIISTLGFAIVFSALFLIAKQVVNKLSQIKI